eukprot:2051291-Rhodomonas_salina.1
MSPVGSNKALLTISVSIVPFSESNGKTQIAGQIVALIACQPFHLHWLDLSQITSVTQVATDRARASRVDEVRVCSGA